MMPGCLPAPVASRCTALVLVSLLLCFRTLTAAPIGGATPLPPVSFDDCASSAGSPGFFPITDFGARNSSITPAWWVPGDNARAITAAFAAASAFVGKLPSPSPAFVYVPPGTFVTGSFNLSSYVYLCLGDGAELRGSNNASDYVLVQSVTSDTGPFDYPLVFVYKAEHTGVLGSGAGAGTQGGINGGLNDPPGNHILSYNPATNFLVPTEWPLPGCSYFSCRPKLMVARLSSSLTFSGASLLNSALWTFTLSQCDGIVIDGMTIAGSRQYPNNDGLDCITCSNLAVTNSDISTGDDCIAIISHNEQPTANITMANLTLRSSSAAIKVSVYEKAATGGVQDVRATNITVMDTNRGVCVDPRWGAGNISRLSFSHMHIETHFFSTAWWGAAEPLYITSTWQSGTHAWQGGVNDVSFSHISMHSEAGVFLYANTSLGVPPLTAVAINHCDLLVDTFSNISSPQRDYRPSQPPQQVFNVSLPALYVDGAVGVTVNDTLLAFAMPRRSYYAGCVEVAPGSGVTQTGVKCVNGG